MPTEAHNIASASRSRGQLFRWLGWFSMANAAVLACVGVLYLNHLSWPSSALALIYLVLVYVGHHVLMAAGPLLVIVSPVIVIRPSSRLVTACAVVVISLVIGVYVLDGLLWSQSHFHLNALTAQILGWRSWIFVAAIVGIALVFESLLVVRVRAWINGHRDLKGRWVGGVSAAALLGAWFLYAWADANYFVPLTSIAERLPVYKGFSAKRNFAKLGLVDLERARELELTRRASANLADEERRLLDYPAAPLECDNQDRKNLLIIMIDTWRFDMLSEELTPNIAELARIRGQSFRNHFSGGNGSRSGAFSFFYGLPPGYWPSVEAVQKPAPLVTELLGQGYETAIYSSGPLSSPVELDRSAFSSIKELHISAPHGELPWKRDRIMLEDWLEWLESRDDSRPFFSFLFFDGVTGNQAPDDYPVRFEPQADSEMARRFAGYQSATHYVDSLVGEVLSRLEQDGLMDDTVILITADHGEEFDESGAGLESHGSGFTRYQLQVPLLTAWPGREARSFQHRTSHYDVTPTLFEDLLGCSNSSEDVSVGHNLFDETDWQWLITGSYFNYAIVEPDRLTITFPSGAFEVHDWDYGLMEDAGIRPRIIAEAISANTRFYAQ